MKTEKDLPKFKLEMEQLLKVPSEEPVRNSPRRSASQNLPASVELSSSPGFPTPRRAWLIASAIAIVFALGLLLWISGLSPAQLSGFLQVIGLLTIAFLAGTSIYQLRALRRIEKTLQKLQNQLTTLGDRAGLHPKLGSAPSAKREPSAQSPGLDLRWIHQASHRNTRTFRFINEGVAFRVIQLKAVPSSVRISMAPKMRLDRQETAELLINGESEEILARTKFEIICETERGVCAKTFLLPSDPHAYPKESFPSAP